MKELSECVCVFGGRGGGVGGFGGKGMRNTESYRSGLINLQLSCANKNKIMHIIIVILRDFGSTTGWSQCTPTPSRFWELYTRHTPCA